MRRWHHSEFSVPDLVDRKAGQGLSVSLVLPARNEEATVARVVDAYVPLLDVGLIDEIVVVDSLSTDATAAVAAAAGARVVAVGEVRPDVPAGPGKGEAMWQGLLASRGDLVVYCDADVLDAGPHYLVGLLGPLLNDPQVSLVKGFYQRPIVDEGGAVEEHGGRVTELTARPILSLLRPDLAELVQPLAGEYAGRRSLFEALPFPVGYGIEIALLLDTHARLGPGAINQVDLGVRTHRHQSQQQLGVMAAEVLTAALRRFGLDPEGTEMRQFTPEAHAPVTTPLKVTERPPASSLPDLGVV